MACTTLKVVLFLLFSENCKKKEQLLSWRQKFVKRDHWTWVLFSAEESTISARFLFVCLNVWTSVCRILNAFKNAFCCFSCMCLGVEKLEICMDEPRGIQYEHWPGVGIAEAQKGAVLWVVCPVQEYAPPCIPTIITKKRWYSLVLFEPRILCQWAKTDTSNILQRKNSLMYGI